MVKIFIATNPGFFNKGDAALVTGTVKTLNHIPNVEISLLTSYPEFESTRCNLKLIEVSKDPSTIYIFKISRFFIQSLEHICLSLLNRSIGFKVVPKKTLKAKFLDEYYNSDIIIASLDDSFTTLYGPEQFFRIFNLILLSNILGKKVILYAGSIGPFKNKLYEILGCYIINRSDLVTLREALSFEYLKRIGVSKPPMYVTADLAFCMEPTSPTRAMEIFSKEQINLLKKPIIGISLSRIISKWSFPELDDLDLKYQKYVILMAKVIDHLIETYSATIVFIPQVIGPDENKDDRKTAEDIYHKAKNKDQIKLIMNEYSPEELRAITGLFDLLISARTHAAISAAMMHVPFVAIEYKSHKTRGIIGKMLDCENLVYDIQKLDFESLVTKINDVWINRESISEELKLKIEGINEKAMYNGELVQKIIIETAPKNSPTLSNPSKSVSLGR